MPKPPPAFLLAAALLLGAPALPIEAQIPKGVTVGKGWSFPYFEGTVLKAGLSGLDAKPLSGGLVQVTEFQMKLFKDGDEKQVDLLVEAPECVFDTSSKIVSSSGRLRVTASGTNLAVEGLGFLWTPARDRKVLTISNQVHTVVLRQPGAAPLEIFADRLVFLLYEPDAAAQTPASRQVTYTGHVRVTDPDLELRADQLYADLPASGQSLDKVTAEGHVIIVNAADQSQVTGDRAVYIAGPENEIIDLTGQPAWKDRQREVHADRFVIDRRHRTFLGEGNALLKLPAQALGQPELPGAAPAVTSGFAEITADRITTALPGADQKSPRQIAAEGHVIIRSPDGQSEATAGRAVYQETTGTLELSGTPCWKSGQREVHGDLLVFQRDRGLFEARGHARVLLPGDLLGRSLSLPPSAHPERLEPRAADASLEITAAHFTFTPGEAVFENNVQARLRTAGTEAGLLACASLTLSLQNGQVNRIIAQGQVALSQPFRPDAPSGPATARRLTCDTFEVQRNPETGLLRAATARNHVQAEVLEKATPASEPRLRQRLQAGLLEAAFSSATNQIESMIAEREVRLEVDARLATGGRAIYRLENGIGQIEVSEQPEIISDEAIFRHATLLRWNVQTGHLRCLGPFVVLPNPDRIATNGLFNPKKL